uniref:hypothetical protein n=1 Tax=Treponema endosymbiont of Eucomonympha sp. TaxID=1580831 RepID=UPI000AD97DD5
YLQNYLPSDKEYDNLSPLDVTEPIDLILEGITPIENINLSDFTQALQGNLGFESVTARIYAGLNDKQLNLNNNKQLKLSGSISADCWQKYEKENPPDDKIRLFPMFPSDKGDDSAPPGDAVFRGNLPPLTGNPNHVLSSNETEDYVNLTPSLGDIELEKVFNEFPERFDIRFDDMSLETITFIPAEIETMDSLQLYIDMTLDISLAFVAADPDKPAVICLDDIPGIDAGGEQDIFGRKSLEENGELFDGVQAATLRLSYDNSLTSSDLTANIRNSKDARALTVRPFTVKHGTNQTVEIALDAGYVRNNLLYPKDIELAFIPDKDGTLFSFGPGEDGTGGSFTLRSVEAVTALDHTFYF